MHRRQTTRLMATVTAVALLAGAAFARANRDLGQASEDWLLRTAFEWRNRHIERATHVRMPVSDSFDALLEPVLPELEAVRKTVEPEAPDVVDARQAVIEGRRPFSALPPAWVDAIEQHLGVARRALHASHAAVVHPPYFFTMFGVLGSRPEPFGLHTVVFAVRLAALSGRRALEQGDITFAGEVCVDSLGLARDVAYSGLVGQMVAGAIVSNISAVCRAAISRFGAEASREFVGQLTAIRKAWPPFSDAMEGELVFNQLVLRDFWPRRSREQLPQDMELSDSSTKVYGPLQGVRRALFGRWARRENFLQLRALTAAADREPIEAEVTLIPPTSYSWRLAGLGEVSPPETWVRFARRWRTFQARLVQLQLLAVLCAARQQTGHWPYDLAQAGMEAPVDPRTGAAVYLEHRKGELWLSFVPQGPLTEEALDLRVDDEL